MRSNATIAHSLRPVRCRYEELVEVDSLATFFSVISGLSSENAWWFRGHRDVSWQLVPSALRYDTVAERERALGLQTDFRRIAETKLRNIPSKEENLKWMQLAQHYGLPTRLLDWTEVATYALFFACEVIGAVDAKTNGVVFLMNPEHIATIKGRPGVSSLGGLSDEGSIRQYFALGGRQSAKGLPTIAIRPVWNSDRLMMQRSVFTLHGSVRFDLDGSQAPSLVGIPILGRHKGRLMRDLMSAGVDKMTLFPELEHACESLMSRANLKQG
ncbi:MAG: FRG domain-containing protein [candidate division Zixibacteria bacterium]|nr:FRG domain-containing protein [candidate division Zixibacteria bacterium]